MDADVRADVCLCFIMLLSAGVMYSHVYRSFSLSCDAHILHVLIFIFSNHFMTPSSSSSSSSSCCYFLSQILLLEKSGELLRSMQSEAKKLNSTLRILKRRRARREGVKEEESSEEEEQEEIKTIVKHEQTQRQMAMRPSAQFAVANVNYFCT